MKLLLTSSGNTNKSIEKALLELLGKPFTKANLTFVPTAANVGWHPLRAPNDPGKINSGFFISKSKMDQKIGLEVGYSLKIKSEICWSKLRLVLAP